MNFNFVGGNSALGLPLNAKEGSVVKEGWIYKRGEFLKIWSARYFVLLDTGSLIGFRDKPDAEAAVNPAHHFTIIDCQVKPVDKSNQYVFTLKALQSTTVVERTFCANTEKERESWILALETVSSGSSKQQHLVSLALAASSVEDLCQESLAQSFVDKKVTLQSFELLKVLGKGAFGKVIMCKQRSTEKVLAMKVMKKRMLLQNGTLHHIVTEHRVLKTTSHPFLTSLEYSFQTGEQLCFVMEYVAGGDLLFHLEKAGRFSEHRTRFYAAEVTLGLSYLHSLGIIHRDLKVENILLGVDGHVKIADFGLCKENMVYERTTSTFCGTPTYMAPELIEHEVYGREADWWAFGVLVYEMICGVTPFYSSDNDELYWLIVNNEVEFPSYVSYTTKCFIEDLLTKDPKIRLGGGSDDANEVMFHGFFEDVVWTDLLQKNVTPPFIPQLAGATDTHFFPAQFTGRGVTVSVASSSVGSAEYEYDFLDFSFQDLPFKSDTEP